MHLRRFAGTLCAVLSLSYGTVGLMACATQPTATQPANLTTEQRFYQVQGDYNVALAAAVAYAKSPIANREVVTKLNQANQPVRAAISYANMYFQCKAAPTVPAEGCTGFTQQGAEANLQVILTATRTLVSLIPTKG